jgi:secondary thiamine-phosphate synthase enzyme
MKHHFENHDVVTEKCGQFIDITDGVLDAVTRSGVCNGQVAVHSPHTTCAVVIQEHESGFMGDFVELMERLVPRESRYYRHDDLEIRTDGIEEDTADFPNGHSHCRAALLSSTSQTIPIVGGTPLLGQWHRVFFCELDRGSPQEGARPGHGRVSIFASWQLESGTRPRHRAVEGCPHSASRALTREDGA